ncbi:haloacid dehalogenase type II [Afipia sp. GAS231]|uniref:haloacid dehalogenase type II n=1 Tax=Afipia sp. GAS231 TaxID=1882747 RepID=UPI000879E874|nr:haloacid dehalogenase type II [Afipia sp. GAS231]SDO24428.1 2-haloacid dehalogenase [Afipia sp. GAS231]
MSAHRRDFLHLVAAGVAAAAIATPSVRAQAPGPKKIRAIAFDGFPIIDPRPVFARAEAMFPGKGGELSNAWRTRQFEYTWLRTMSGSYVDFWQVTEQALVFAARLVKLEMSPTQRDQLMESYLRLKAWPDVAAALKQLKDAGIRMAFLSNFTAEMLDAAVRNSGLEGIFEPHLSTDRVQAFKPDPRAYRMGVDAFGMAKEEIAFAAFAGWDAAGAKRFGYPTFWVNRANAPLEELDVAPDGTGAGLQELVAFAGV